MDTESKVIPNYPNYRVDTDGNVYGPKGKLKHNVNGRGYCNVSLVAWAGNTRTVKTYSVHALVASAFCTRPAGTTEINHKDTNKRNNSALNLEWVTSSDNKLHATAHGLYPVKEQHYRYTTGEQGAWRESRREDIHNKYRSNTHG